MRLGKVLAAAALVGLPAAAMAQPVDGLYVGAGAGVNWLGQQNVNAITDTTTGQSLAVGGSHLSYDIGFVGLASVGYGFGNGLRLELEGNYRNNGTKLSSNLVPGSINSTNQTYGVMVNALYDIDVGESWVYPYLGAGVGYEWTQFDNASGSEGSAAAQAILGAAFPIDGVPGLSATIEARWMGTFNNETFTGTSKWAGLGLKFAPENNISGLIGLRYAFNTPQPAPAPAPVAAPAPPPARTYLVFFDWDKADLTDRARAIIGEAAQASQKLQVTKIEATGYTDNTGTPQYNLKLSVRRAQAVKAELIKDGVPANIIDIKGLGEANPLVPTAPQTREPQNRRVEIDLK
jgi:OmpA-OmpF porin, OOP family